MFRGRHKESDSPCVAKEHNFGYHGRKQKSIARALNASLTQAKLYHPGVCEVYEIQVKVEGGKCIVYHGLEELERDLAQDIEERRKENKPYTEREILDLAKQLASALSYAHGLGIAHRNVCPGNILRREGSYKLCGFSNFFAKKNTEYSKESIGGVVYMSPQTWRALTKCSDYHVFKTEVFALGATLLHAAALRSSQSLCSPDETSVNKAVQAGIGCLPVSMQTLVSGMMAAEELRRPSMQEVYMELCAVTCTEQMCREYQLSLPGYEIVYSKVHNPYTRVELSHAKYRPTSDEVVIKSYISESLEEINQYINEGINLARFHHPNISSLLAIRLAANETPCRVHFAMERHERNLLEEILERTRSHRPCSETEMREFLRQVGLGLTAAKGKNLSHGDIKPDNIYIDSKGRYKLNGFGNSWARLVKSFTCIPQEMVAYKCSQERMALLSEGIYNPFKADVYSLGLTTLYYATLIPPFRLSERNFESAANEQIAQLKLSRKFKKLLQCMLADEEENRPDIEEVVHTVRT